MKDRDRIGGLLDDLDETLTNAAVLVSRGRANFDNDLATQLAFEALSNRVGEVCKQLTRLDPGLFFEPTWSAAARNRDKIVHHYNTINADVLWATIAVHLPKLGELARSKRTS